jgi:hypothetical protein
VNASFPQPIVASEVGRGLAARSGRTAKSVGLSLVGYGLSEIKTLPARGLLAIIWVYQRTFSPLLPAMFGPSCGCRFYPSCSIYAGEAIARHGARRGAWLALVRLAKCTPLHPGGIDLVPVKPVCRRPSPAVLRTR